MKATETERGITADLSTASSRNEHGRSFEAAGAEVIESIVGLGEAVLFDLGDDADLGRES